MPTMRRGLGVAALLSLAAGVVIGAQNIPAPVFRSGVDLVQVEVSVLDKNRQPVRGLTQADFSVLEEGKPRPIVAFAPVELPTPDPIPPGTAGWLRTVPSDVADNAVAPTGRMVAIVFDNVRFTDLPLARRIARATVDALGPQDLGGVIFITGFANGGVRQNFTADKARLLDVIARPISPSPVNANGDFLRWGPDCYCDTCSYDKVSDVAEAMTLVPTRRKVMVLVTARFPEQSGQGNCEMPIRQARERAERSLAQANATVHVVDPSGSEPLQLSIGTRSAAPLRNSAFARQATMPFLANITHGQFVINDNGAELRVPGILNETASYYLLAFPQADRAKAKDGLNRFQVKVNRRNVTVQSRSVYVWGDTATSREAAALRSPLADAIESSLPRPDAPLSLTATPFAGPGQRLGSVAVVLRTEPVPDAATRTDGGGSDRADVVIAAVDPEGKVVSSVNRTASMPWAQGSGRPPAYEVLARLDLKPGRYEIRAASDVTGRSRSSVYGFVEVPDFTADALAVSGVVFEASPRSMAAPKDAFADLLPIVPTARRGFDATDLVTVFARIYRQANIPAPTVLTRVVDAVGKVVFEERREGAEPDEQWDLPIDRLAAGEYLLTVEVTSEGHSAVQRARFSVR